MNSEEYLKKSENVEIRVIGLGKRQAEKIRRPTIDLLKNCCETKDFVGSAIFSDTATFIPKKDIIVSRAELWYGGQRISFRAFPDIKLTGNRDTLTINYSLQIDRNTGNIIKLFM